MSIDRRAILGAGLGLAGIPLLSGCGGGGQTGRPNPSGGIQRADSLADLVPKFVQFSPLPPDLPASENVDPGYLGYPRRLVRSVSGKAAKDGTRYRAMTPAWWPIPPGPENNDYYQAMNDALGLRIDFTVIDGNDYGNKLATTLASKRVPDITQVPVWNRPQDFSAAIVPTLFEDLTDLLSGDIATKWPNLANLPTKAWQACVFGDGLYGIPASVDGGISDALFYRADLFEERGLEPPTSAQAWLELCEQITDPREDRWACGDVMAEARRMYGAGATWWREAGELVNAVESDAFVEALAFARKLFDREHVHPGIVSGNQADAKQLFESGQMWQYVDGVGAWHEALDRQRPGKPSFRMLPFPPFAGDGSSDPTYYSGGYARMQAHIKKGLPAESVEELLGALNYIAAPYGTREYDLVNFGPEGVTHKKNADGVPELTEQGMQQVTSTYAFLVARPDVISKPRYPDYVRDMHAWQKLVAPHIQEDLLGGLNVEEPPRFQTLQQPLDDIQSDILRGRAPVSDWKPAVRKWRRDGGDELREFYQKNLDKVGR